GASRRNPFHRRASENAQRQNHAPPSAPDRCGRRNPRRRDDAGGSVGHGKTSRGRRVNSSGCYDVLVGYDRAEEDSTRCLTTRSTVVSVSTWKIPKRQWVKQTKRPRSHALKPSRTMRPQTRP